MKKNVAVLAALFVITIAGAQTENMPAGVQLTPVTPAYEAPSIVISQFNAKYPDVAESWKKDGENFSATFLDPRTNMGHIIVYDPNGNILSKNRQVEPKSFPKPIGDYYRTNYPGEQFDIWLKEEKNGNKLYYSVRNADTLRFDKNGKNIPSSPASHKELK